MARTALTAAIAALAFLASALPALAQEPHENPDTAPWVFDGVSVLWKYSQALDYVLGRSPSGVEALQGEASRANIPEELRDTVDSFLSLGSSLAGLILGIETDMETSKKMLAQFRLEDAEASSAAAARKLNQAYSELREMERGAQRTGRWWRADTAAVGSALRVAYEEVLNKLLRLRRLLDLLSEMQQSLTQQAEVVQGIARGDMARLEELKGLLAQGAASPEILARLEELKGGVLQPTTITLAVEPTVAFVGEKVESQGTLSAREEPLPGRKVTLLLNGSPTSSAVTDNSGAYHGHLVLPYQYVSEMTVQALYYPEGADLGWFLGSSSPQVVIQVLYYETKLSLEVPGNAYPGRNLRLQGRLDYGDSPMPESRSLLVSWDGEPAAEETVAAAFSLELPVAPETSLGKHRVMVYVPPQKRYAPAWASSEVEVAQAIPVIEFDAPGIVLLPFALDVRGRVYSTLGPLQDASLTIGLGDWQATARSGEDGTFSARLRTGLSLTLVGSQELRVSATPSEPWHRTSSSATTLLLINPINIAGLALALAIPVFFGTHRLGRRRLRAPAAPLPQPVPALVRRESPPAAAEPVQPEAGGSPGAILVALYRGVLRLVQRLTAAVLRPSQTLREFAQECAPRLGPLAGYFQEFTLMIERLLYSRHGPSQVDATRGRELSQRLEEGGKGEGA